MVNTCPPQGLQNFPVSLFSYDFLLFWVKDKSTIGVIESTIHRKCRVCAYIQYIHTHTQRSRSFLDWFDCESSWSSIDPTIETQLKSRNTGWYTSTIYSWSNTWCCEPAIRLSKSIWDLEKNESNATICYRTISNQIFKWQYIDVYDGRVAWGAKSIERSLEKHRMYRYTCTRIKLNM